MEAVRRERDAIVKDLEQHMKRAKHSLTTLGQTSANEVAQLDNGCEQHMEAIQGGLGRLRKEAKGVQDIQKETLAASAFDFTAESRKITSRVLTRLSKQQRDLGNARAGEGGESDGE